MPASQDNMQLSKAAFGCFILEQLPQTNDNPPRKRAKFTPQRKKEIALLRGKACLRCRLLKLRCSVGNPCQMCLRAATLSTQSKHLRFSYCIRASLKDLSIFGYSLPPRAKRETIVQKAKALISASIELNFPLDFEWNLNSLSKHVSSWLVNPAKSSTSKVGILSSTGFQRLIQAQVGLDLSHSFQQMLFACTMAYNQDTSVEISQFSDEELQQITSVAGECVLASLEKRLAPTTLEKCKGSLEYSQALFLILLGTILAVGYMQPIQETPTSATASRVYPTLSKTFYESVQEHLCATLAHYMIYVGHKTTTTFDSSQKHLITKAYERWQAQGHFQWMTPVPFRGTLGYSDSKKASPSNGGEDRSTPLVWDDVWEELGQQERRLPSTSTCLDSRYFCRSAGTGVVYHPTITVLPDHSVEHFPTNVFDDTRSPRSRSAQFLSPEITSNLPLDFMGNSSAGLPSTSIRQYAVENSRNLVERLDTPSVEMPSWTTVTFGSSAAWTETVNLDEKQVMRKRTPLSREERKKVHEVRSRYVCFSCSRQMVMCSPEPRMCEYCNKTMLFRNLYANNNLLCSRSGFTDYPGTVFTTNELRSNSSERLTARNTTFNPGSARKGSSQTSRQYSAKGPFTAEDVQAPLRNLPLHEQHSNTNKVSEDLIMDIGEEGTNRLMQEPNLLDVAVCGDVHSQYYNLLGRFKAGDGVHIDNTKSISRRLLI